MGELSSSSVDAWDSQALLPLSACSGSSKGLQASNPGFVRDIIEIGGPAMSVEFGRHIVNQGLSLNEYSYEEVCHTVDQIADATHPLRDMKAIYLSSIVESILIHNFKLPRGMITVASSSIVGPRERC